MGNQLDSGSRVWNCITGLLAFVLSAIMGVAFVLLVEKTHKLLSSAAFAEHSVSAPARERAADRVT